VTVRGTIRIRRENLSYFWTLGDLAFVLCAYAAAIQLRQISALGMFTSNIPTDLIARLDHHIIPILCAYVIAAYLNGLLDPDILLLRSKTLLSVMFAAATHAILLSSFYYFIDVPNFPRSIFVTLAIVETLFIGAWRLLFVRNMMEVRPTRIITLGNPDNLCLVNQTIETATSAIQLERSLTDFDEFTAYMDARDPDDDPVWVILSIEMLQYRERFFDLVARVHTDNISALFVLAESVFALIAGPNLGSIGDIPLVPLVRPASSATHLIVRVMDISIAITLLTVAAPILIAAAIGISISSTGPVFYKQTRIGLRGRKFQILKLRTMIADAEKATGPVLSHAGDARVTRFGRILRVLRIDELPQLINVLNGDMTVFGPRPERPEFVSQFSQEIPGYESRHFIKPGVTGLAQVMGDYQTSPDRKLIFDLRHLSGDGLAFKADLLIKTLKTVLTRRGT